MHFWSIFGQGPAAGAVPVEHAILQKSGKSSFTRLPPCGGAANLSGCAHAADPWSLTINVAQIRGAGGGGAAPPRTPLLFRGARPPGPRLRALGCSGCSLSRDRATGSCAARGRTFSQNSDLFFILEQATCPGQLRCQGQNLFSKIRLFLNKTLVLGSFAAWAELVLEKGIVF